MMENEPELFGEIPVLLPVKRLARHCNPFHRELWGVRVTKQMVRCAIRERRFERTPGTINHAARIAFLAEHEALDAIEVDVGVPMLNYCSEWMVLDGNHRLAAAIYAQRPLILARVGGQLDYAKHLFGVECIGS